MLNLGNDAWVIWRVYLVIAPLDVFVCMAAYDTSFSWSKEKVEGLDVLKDDLALVMVVGMR